MRNIIPIKGFKGNNSPWKRKSISLSHKGAIIAPLNPHIYLCIIFSILLIWTSGCANTVTTKIVTLTMRVQIKLGPNAVISKKHNYHIIFSKVASPNIKLPPFELGNTTYFPTPGRTFDEEKDYTFRENGKIPHLYQKFFYTWSDYILINNSNNSVAKFYTSTITSTDFFESTTTNNYTYTAKNNFIRNTDYTYTYNATTQFITFEFDITHLSETLSGTRYIHVMTSKRSDDTYQSGYFQDALSKPKIIILSAHHGQTWTDELDNYEISDAMDIKQCIIDIF